MSDQLPGLGFNVIPVLEGLLLAYRELMAQAMEA
jgi:hypothetical protein